MNKLTFKHKKFIIMKKLFTFSFLLLLISFTSFAQLKIGAPAGAPNSSAILDLNAGAANKGLLLPSVGLISTTSFAPLVAHVPGMVVYNTATANDVVPGLYYNDGTKWAAITSSNSVSNATYSGGLTCGALSGTYQTGAAMTASNTKQVSINVVTAGSYIANTNSQNGVSFGASGTLLTTGNSTITMTASGTPAASGLFNYTASVGGQTCVFAVTFAGAATFNCGSVSQAQSPIGALNSSSSGSYTVPYTGGNGASYAATTLSNNGFNLTRAAGTYAANGGNVVYNLSYVSGSSTTASFTPTECGAVVVFGDALRAALSTNTIAYDNALPNTWVNITSAEYLNLLSTVAGSAKYGANDGQMAGNQSIGNNNTIALNSTQGKFAASNYPIAITIRNANDLPAGTYDWSGFQLKLSSTSISSGYATIPASASLPSTSVGLNVQSYFVLKAPTNFVTTSSFIGCFSAGSARVGWLAGTPAGSTTYYNAGNVSTLASTNSTYFIGLQVIGSPTKQW